MNSAYTVIVVSAAVAANLLFAAMFIARVIGARWANALGLTGTAMAIPLGAASVMAVTQGLGGWAVALPAVFVVFAVVELVADVLLDLEVRSSRWLWPYLTMFYLAQWALIGAAFIASSAGGVAVLATYFVCLAATGWSYRRVGHGNPAAGDSTAGTSRSDWSAPRHPAGR